LDFIEKLIVVIFALYPIYRDSKEYTEVKALKLNMAFH